MRRAHAGLRRPARRRAQGARTRSRRRSASWPRRAARHGDVAGDAAAASRSPIRLEALAPCHVVVEAIVEDLGAKRELFAALEKIVGDDCILASQHLLAFGDRDGRGVQAAGARRRLPLLQPGAGDEDRRGGRRRADRAVGRPMRSPRSPSASATRRCAARTRRASSSTTPAARSCPKSLRVLSEGVADFATIDRILVDAAGFRIGPFGLMDLVGLDIAHAVMKSMYQQYFEEPKYRPSFLCRAARRRGPARPQDRPRLVRYDKDGVAEAARRAASRRRDKPRVGVGRSRAEGAAGRSRRAAERKPAPEAVCFVAPLGKDATTAALEHGARSARAPWRSIRCSASPSAAR